MSKPLKIGAVMVLVVVVILGILFPQKMRAYESIAVWLEGIALVAIFIWDRVDGNEQHRETIEQLKTSRKQVEALESSERAWIMADILTDVVTIRVSESRTGTDSEKIRSNINVTLRYRNAGRVPCWITEKRIQFLLPDLKAIPGEPFFDETAMSDDFPEPAVVGETLHWEIRHLTCNDVHVLRLGNEPGGNAAIVYGIIKYRDVFGADRETRFGFQISPHGYLRRMRSVAYNNNT